MQLVGYLSYWQMGFNSVFKGLSYKETGMCTEWTHNHVNKEYFETGKKETRSLINFFVIGISFWDISLRQGHLVPDVSRQRNGLIVKGLQAQLL